MKKQLTLLLFFFTLVPFAHLFSFHSGPGSNIEPPVIRINTINQDYLVPEGVLSVSGNVLDVEGNPLEKVEVCLDADLIEYPRCRVTDEDGFYFFSNVPADVDYELRAYSDAPHLENVSTLDYVIIARHLLGHQKMESYLHLIAADANADNKVSIRDLSDLRKIILGAYSEFPTNDSYRFIDASYTFPDENNPWPTEEINPYVIKFNPTTDTTHNFIGIKIGHVSF